MNADLIVTHTICDKDKAFAFHTHHSITFSGRECTLVMAALNYLVDYASQLSTTDYDDIGSINSSIVGPGTQISNEPELRLKMREVDVKGKERRFLAYAEENKGLLGSQ